ncbi:Piso0_002143 [Millerozyma farinosa CBS 7064]|uniref:Piso0_002143 protein n=1 Tax=Pichia sorbitophila (strain ATCC MYA-4447 / BCRC 22081 / CBS 7064 / NBRC 10061 / NRRL Y-12695) TaxID=559304 RepID=G8YBT7_PICSO|nr:Piso0_002143 [Millerozyma farinosa CBS 7064]
MKLHYLLPIVLYSSRGASLTLEYPDSSAEEKAAAGEVDRSSFKKLKTPEAGSVEDWPIRESESTREKALNSRINSHKFMLPHVASALSLSSVSPLYVTKTVTELSSPTADLDDASAESTQDLSPTVKVNSRKSWIKEFLNFKSLEKMKAKLSSTESSRPYVDPSGPTGKLKTKIKSYENKASDTTNLKEWTKSLGEERKQEQESESESKEPKYWKQNTPKLKTNIESLDGANAEDSSNSENSFDLDVNDFVSYLVSQGFNSSDLEFLKSDNLDYEFSEIEEELNMIHDEHGLDNININGESSDGSTTFSRYTIVFALSATFFSLLCYAM